MTASGTGPPRASTGAPSAAVRARSRGWVIGGAFLALLGALMMSHVGDPWRYPNDDNGAWFSAVAKSHRYAGLKQTRGQDFFLVRDSGELVPYLHHPPLPGLILAAAFRITGAESPRTARATFGLLHLITFALIAGIAARLWSPAREGGLYALALSVPATVPMSAFYGKMPNHEVPGLLFFTLGVFAWGFGPPSGSLRRPILACCAWALAAFSSWHAIICVIGWLVVQLGLGPRRRTAAALAAVAFAAALVVLHLFWAGDWKLLSSQSTSTQFWFAGSDGASWADRAGFLRHAFGIGVERFAYLPALLALGWLLTLAVDRARGRGRPGKLELNLLGLALGSAAYYLMFPRAVSYHAYQGFYVLPFVALASPVALQRIMNAGPLRSRFGLRRWLPAVVITLICMLGVATTTRMYRKPSPRVAEVVRSLESQYR